MKNFKRHFSFSLLSALIVLTCSINAHAEQTDYSFTSIVMDDVKTGFTAPLSWDRENWQTFAWASAAVLGTAALADKPTRTYMCNQSQMGSCPGAGTEVPNDFLTTVERFGQTYPIGVVGIFYLAGIASDNQKSVTVSQDLVAASVTTMLLNQTLKTIINRSRPRENMGNGDFPGNINLVNNSSFPSGHSTEAFTMASVIASHYDQAWVGILSYTTAGLVGVARMYHDAHWASDVVTSAFIGIYTGKMVVKHNENLRGQKHEAMLLPLFTPDMAGIQLVKDF